MSPASLRDANRVCLRTAATRFLIIGAAVRSWSSDATRLARNSDFWLTTDDCAQAASDAAAIPTANSRTTFAAAGSQRDWRSVRPVPMSKYQAQIREIQARSIGILQSPTCAPAQAETTTPHGPNPIGAEPRLQQGGPALGGGIGVECGDWVTACNDRCPEARAERASKDGPRALLILRGSPKWLAPCIEDLW